MKDAVFFHQSFTQARVSAMGQAPHKSNEQNTAGMLGLKMLDVILSQTIGKELLLSLLKPVNSFRAEAKCWTAS